MNDQLEMLPGTNRNLALSQYLTPPKLAQRVVEWAGVSSRTCSEERCYDQRCRMRVLEPSAGNGALVRPLVAAGAMVTAFDIDERYQHDLQNALGYEFGQWGIANFLELQPVVQYNLCVMNPPYENGLDVQFILHALRFAPRVVGIFRSQLLHGKTRKQELWSRVRPTRIAYLSERPDFGGEYSAMTDFIVCELVARDIRTYVGQGESRPVQLAPDACAVEWW